MEKRIFKDWLSFSRKERSALLILIVLVALFFLIPYLFPKKKAAITTAPSTLKENAFTSTKAADFFYFDPNTLDSEGFRKLGLRDKTIRTIIHYREKGGRFKKPEDIRKIYGLRHEEAERIIPYIQLSQNTTNTIINKRENPIVKKAYTFPIEVNKAGEEHWAALPGISMSLAKRIVHYRDAIHGFKSIDQIGKTYGLTPATFVAIKPFLRLSNEDIASPSFPEGNPATISEKQTVAGQNYKVASVEKVNINTASEQELLSQKHIPRAVAKAIVIYREQHGPYKSIDDVKKIVFIQPDMFTRIAPYLKVD